MGAASMGKRGRPREPSKLDKDLQKSLQDVLRGALENDAETAALEQKQAEEKANHQLKGEAYIQHTCDMMNTDTVVEGLKERGLKDSGFRTFMNRAQRQMATLEEDMERHQMILSALQLLGDPSVQKELVAFITTAQSLDTTLKDQQKKWSAQTADDSLLCAMTSSKLNKAVRKEVAAQFANVTPRVKELKEV